MKIYEDYTGPVWSETLKAARAQGRRIVHCPPPPGRTLDEDGVMFFVKVLFHDNERLAEHSGPIRTETVALNVMGHRRKVERPTPTRPPVQYHYRPRTLMLPGEGQRETPERRMERGLPPFVEGGWRCP